MHSSSRSVRRTNQKEGGYDMTYTRRLLTGAILTVILAVMALAATGPAHAASFTVNSTVDAVDAAPGDGACATLLGQCTLRAAVQETNALPGADIITLPAGTYTLSIAGAGEDAAASGDL